MSQNKKMPGAGTPGDNRNTNTQKEETIMNSITNTPDNELDESQMAARLFRAVAPEWATNQDGEAGDLSVSVEIGSDGPVITWYTEDLVDVDGVVAAVTREDRYDADLGIVKGELRLDVFTPEPWVVKDQYAARRIARQLLEAADAYSLIQATEKPWRP